MTSSRRSTSLAGLARMAVGFGRHAKRPCVNSEQELPREGLCLFMQRHLFSVSDHNVKPPSACVFAKKPFQPNLLRRNVEFGWGVSSPGVRERGNLVSVQAKICCASCSKDAIVLPGRRWVLPDQGVEFGPVLNSDWCCLGGARGRSGVFDPGKVEVGHVSRMGIRYRVTTVSLEGDSLHIPQMSDFSVSARSAGSNVDLLTSSNVAGIGVVDFELLAEMAALHDVAELQCGATPQQAGT